MESNGGGGPPLPMSSEVAMLLEALPLDVLLQALPADVQQQIVASYTPAHPRLPPPSPAPLPLHNIGNFLTGSPHLDIPNMNFNAGLRSEAPQLPRFGSAQNILSPPEDLRSILDGPMKNIITQEVERQVQEIARGIAQPSPSEGRRGRKQRAPNEELMIHRKMLALLGLSKEGRRVPLLPEPLKEGEPRRKEDGEDLYNPEWNKPWNFPVNHEYLSRAVSLVMAEEKVPEADRGKLLGKAKVYFANLKGHYNCHASVDNPIRNKKAQKIIDLRRTARKKAKAHELRKAKDTFRNRYGEDNTEGIEKALVTDYMSSEITDEEKSAATSSSRAQAKVLNVEPIGWRSKKLLRLYACLRQINAVDPLIAAGTPVHRRVTVQASERSDAKLPPSGKVAFRSWISEVWEKRMGAEDFTYAEDEPAEYTILNLTIPDNHLAPDDLAMLADDEADSDPEDGDE